MTGAVIPISNGYSGLPFYAKVSQWDGYTLLQFRPYNSKVLILKEGSGEWIPFIYQNMKRNPLHAIFLWDSNILIIDGDGLKVVNIQGRILKYISVAQLLKKIGLVDITDVDSIPSQRETIVRGYRRNDKEGNTLHILDENFNLISSFSPYSGSSEGKFASTDSLYPFGLFVDKKSSSIYEYFPMSDLVRIFNYKGEKTEEFQIASSYSLADGTKLQISAHPHILGVTEGGLILYGRKLIIGTSKAFSSPNNTRLKIMQAEKYSPQARPIAVHDGKIYYFSPEKQSIVIEEISR